ncbi:clathrin adaptor complexes medium subunit-like protein [Stylonychia lemnae]|uniref:Clathrin adaptor complexes medium subunit-like protein n=1 Tax=Stylonychia lemnae TaxID=5949 RepID=A0A077ZPA8_STYLE|nr:clathrin adaptor complexes medium subunit-like protein [Stylonychia lemnae]|eukprot:CDW71748.1 clathrin adaptor complexes medium subunit-like protein [Stylonychia lemnae]
MQCFQFNQGLCNFECKFERYQIGKEKDSRSIYPIFEQATIKIHFPEQYIILIICFTRETINAQLTSLPEGVYSYFDKDKTGEWTISSMANQPNTPQDNVTKLSGNIRLNDSQINELPSNIIAIVNIKIKDYTFTGNQIEKIICNLQGNLSKDDQTVFRGYKCYAFAKNIEYRF